MIIAATIRARLNRVGPLASGLAAYGSAEIANRAVRIMAIVVIARRIDAVELGIAALALSLFELIRVLANAGIGQRIIAARADELEAVCATAHRLFWVWCGVVAMVQLSVAVILATLFALPQPALMLALLSLIYAIMPPGLVPVFLLMREGRMGATARVATIQTIADHTLTLALAIVWPGAWAIILPKLLTAPLWTILTRRARPWTPAPLSAAPPVPLSEFTRYGAGVLGAELSNAARAQFGNLIIGATLGVKALGSFYFAFNAGLGITASFVSAFGIVLFPHLCAAAPGRDRHDRFRRGALFGLAVMLPVVLAQIILAPLYVPLLFGAHWAASAPLVSILGLGALPLVAGAATTAWLRAEGRTALDASISLGACIAALAGLAIGAPFGLAMAALGYALGLAAVLIPTTLMLFSRRTPPLQETPA
jgi:lipopolysaccharide exporter